MTYEQYGLTALWRYTGRGTLLRHANTEPRLLTYTTVGTAVVAHLMPCNVRPSDQLVLRGIIFFQLPEIRSLRKENFFARDGGSEKGLINNIHSFREGREHILLLFTFSVTQRYG